jgi:DNA-binding NarL/FixJ family response regulator
MKTPIEVRLIGPTLLCQAVEALLAKVGPIYWEGENGNGESTEDALGGAGGRRRSVTAPNATLVIILIGDGWQHRIAADARTQRRNNAVGPTPRYALIADGGSLDFYGARKMAINAFIGTDEPVSVLVQGIQAAAQNRLYCSPQLLPSLIDAVGNNSGVASTLNEGAPSKGAETATTATKESATASQASSLSAREHEVALHAARGLSNEQIAVFLGISVPTVKFHLMHAFRKLDIQRRTQLYAYMPFFTSTTEALLPPVIE